MQVRLWDLKKNERFFLEKCQNFIRWQNMLSGETSLSCDTRSVAHSFSSGLCLVSWKGRRGMCGSPWQGAERGEADPGGPGVKLCDRRHCCSLSSCGPRPKVTWGSNRRTRFKLLAQALAPGMHSINVSEAMSREIGGKKKKANKKLKKWFLRCFFFFHL